MLRGRAFNSALVSFWRDEKGAIISSEMVAVMTVAGLALTAGLHQVSDAVNSEFEDIACAIRSMDQSYEFAGVSNGKACVSGSSYRDQGGAMDCAPLEGFIEEQAPCTPTIDCLPNAHEHHAIHGVEHSAR